MRTTMSAAVLKSVDFTIVLPRDDHWGIANLADAKVTALRDFDLQAQEIPRGIGAPALGDRYPRPGKRRTARG
jgi:hypothetical protein